MTPDHEHWPVPVDPPLRRDNYPHVNSPPPPRVSGTRLVRRLPISPLCRTYGPHCTPELSSYESMFH
jgi:hypothetical protein